MEILTLADENIPLAKEIFSQFGRFKSINGRNILQDDLKNAGNLIIRSVTKVNKVLLKDSQIKFIGTCTIGEDHVNKKDLEDLDIEFHSAPGCNAQAVAEYVVSALTQYSANRNASLQGKSLGIIGVGNVGKMVNDFAKKLGMKTVLNDPPRERVETNLKFDSFEEVLKCDYITLHVPLNENGSDKTLHLFNEQVFKIINHKTVLINSCRGSVVNNHDLKQALSKNLIKDAIIDVWENEPEIDKELFDLCVIGTPHIAGYSYDAKIRGATMIADKLAAFMKVPNKTYSDPPKEENHIKHYIDIDKGENTCELLKKAFESFYNPLEDHNDLKKALLVENSGKAFDELRKNYKKRREFQIFPIFAKQNNRMEEIIELMSQFNITLKVK